MDCLQSRIVLEEDSSYKYSSTSKYFLLQPCLSSLQHAQEEYKNKAPVSSDSNQNIRASCNSKFKLPESNGFCLKSIDRVVKDECMCHSNSKTLKFQWRISHHIMIYFASRCEYFYC